MNTDHGLKVGDKIKSPSGNVYDVLEVEGRFAAVRAKDSTAYPILFHDGAWRASEGGAAWTVVKLRWHSKEMTGSDTRTLIYDGSRSGSNYMISVRTQGGIASDLTHAEVKEAAEAIVELLNERYPA